ncbi:Uncharacterised protein [Zhongshania aliphaticivorans]|uniref:UPF0276 protein IHBHHGIJ_01467 n=1 Tax=Zhongshania aliphaticivorans TaxID=1470434 RepID=A0A5S9QMQ6_9GAMM|nr:DUF692 domain-containing protein [Zhongshania aliphaticivorans]CAA0088116.1 Uncharacterised protein [Zhongshania aliphaticivorans]CAA0115983.1 Uncharacterised protein [Zhongshania aliphaticivorans]CAA0120358.1 Uncharacterised protein [Zhongshania aliphaticivorans]
MANILAGHQRGIAGLGLRRGLMPAFQELLPGDIDFIEVAPENWIEIGGRYGRQFRAIAEKYPVYLHGLSLNIGGFSPLNTDLLLSIKQFMDDFDCPLYSEHLTYCGDEGQLYDLLPIPFTEEAVSHVAERVKRVQDVLGRRILLENASYYAAPAQEMSESEFINAVLAEADCDLLLDVNNIYVNSINHRYDPYEFLSSLSLERAKYVHIAGHYDEAEDLRVDTHGADIIDPVWALLDTAYERCGPLPTLLERDFNFPPMVEMLVEVDRIKRAQEIATRSASFLETNVLSL